MGSSMSIDQKRKPVHVVREANNKERILEVAAQPYRRMGTPSKLGDNLVASAEDLADSRRIKHARIIEGQGFLFNFQRGIYDIEAAGGKGAWREGYSFVDTRRSRETTIPGGGGGGAWKRCVKNQKRGPLAGQEKLTGDEPPGED